MSSREAIFGNLHRSLGGDAAREKARKSAVEGQLKRAAHGIIPNHAKGSASEMLVLFCDKAEAVQSTVARVSSYVEIPGEVSNYLRQHNLPAGFRMGEDHRLNEIEWSKSKSLEIKRGPSDGSDAVGVSHAFGGAAETGTLVLTSGADNPTTINFLPESHIVIINARDIHGDYETVLDLIKSSGNGKLPRTINMITGPSRSGDIEQTILLGAHGPKNLHIIVVEE